MLRRDSKVHNIASSLFCLLIITRSGLLAGIRWSVCISKFQRNLWVSFSRTNSGLCIHNLLRCSNLIFLYNSQWITFPTQSCLVLYSFCASYIIRSMKHTHTHTYTHTHTHTHIYIYIYIYIYTHTHTHIYIYISKEEVGKDSYKSPGVLNVWLLIYKFIDIIQIKFIWLERRH